MNKMLVAIISLAFASTPAFACNGPGCMPEMSTATDPWSIPCPVMPNLPNKILVQNNESTEISNTMLTLGGWYWDGDSWSLEDFQHVTAANEMSAYGDEGVFYLANYRASGSEASGDAWKSAMESVLQTRGFTAIKNELWVTTVNPVPLGEENTQFFYYENTGKASGLFSDNTLVVKGTGFGDIKTNYYSPYDSIQEREVVINPTWYTP